MSALGTCGKAQHRCVSARPIVFSARPFPTWCEFPLTRFLAAVLAARVSSLAEPVGARLEVVDAEGAAGNVMSGMLRAARGCEHEGGG